MKFLEQQKDDAHLPERNLIKTARKVHVLSNKIPCFGMKSFTKINNNFVQISTAFTMLNWDTVQAYYLWFRADEQRKDFASAGSLTGCI